MPSKAAFHLSAVTKRGETENEFGEPFRESSLDRGGSITGSTGSGPAISVTTERGSVTVLRSEPATAVALPVVPLAPKVPVAPKVQEQ